MAAARGCDWPRSDHVAVGHARTGAPARAVIPAESAFCRKFHRLLIRDDMRAARPGRLSGERRQAVHTAWIDVSAYAKSSQEGQHRSHRSRVTCGHSARGRI